MRTHVLSLAPFLLLTLPVLAQDERISSFGEYSGYSEQLFDEWVTTSRYVEMRDGVRLAVDITRPAIDGVAVDEPYPVAWTHSRYHRNPTALSGSARPISYVDAWPQLQRLVLHGYVVATVGVRGSGASFGRFEGLFSEAETRDAVEMIEWFAAQPWCDGNVGMWGASYLGITQYMAASKAPTALKAIFPDVAAFDMYDLIYPGGVFRDDMLQHWATLTTQLDTETLAPPVATDTDRSLLEAAVAGHADNWDVMAGYSSAPLRDDATDLHEWSHHGPAPYLAQVNEARVPAYHFNGWFDVFALDAVLWFANYEGPQHLLMGDWAHGQATSERNRLQTIEQHRWFDRWLKGIENGVEDEPPVHYALIFEPGEFEWQAAETWPPAGTEELTLFLGDGPSGSVASSNDGRLEASSSAPGADAYRVDPTTTTGSSTRWDNAVGAAEMSYRRLAANDAKSLTYTTDPLGEEVVLVGHPVVTLYVASDTGDVDLHVLLEEVTTGGDVRYVSEGVLRASHRKLGEAPYDNLGLPWQRSFAEDREPLPPGEPTEVVMDLHPIALVFDEGYRIRLTIMGADADNTEETPHASETTLSVYFGEGQASKLVLPVVR